MRKDWVLVCASAVLIATGAGCAGQPDTADTVAPITLAEALPTGDAMDTSAGSEVATSGDAPARRFVPIRGEAELGYTKPVTKNNGKELMTTIKVKNMSTTNSIVGLKVDEYWYDKAGDPVTGDQFRHRKPLLPEEVIEVTLTTPMNPRMDRNQYKFEHANGTVKTTLMPKL